MRKFFIKNREWRACTRGTTAIEFSILAVPFTMFLIAIIELSMYFAASSMMEGAVQDAARRIRTGEVQQTSGQDPEDAFRTALCGHPLYVLDCNKFQYDVEVLNDFTDYEAITKPQYDDEGNLIVPPFEAGGASDVVMIRVFYLYPMLTPLVGQFFANAPNFTRRMISTVVIQVEPYQV